VLAAVRFKDSMRWRGDTAFSRPLRSLLALHGGAVLPFAFAGLRAGRTTHGLRSETAAPIEVSRLVCVVTRSAPLWHSSM
jgi:glycyl-tRNA synthetase beta subunit